MGQPWLVLLIPLPALQVACDKLARKTSLCLRPVGTFVVQLHGHHAQIWTLDYDK